MQFFGQETIKKFIRINNTTARLEGGSLIKLGGQAYNLNDLDIDINTVGVGGLEIAVIPSTLYYVYAVLNNGVPSLIASTSEIKPVSFLSYKKIGAFETNSTSEIVFVYSYLGTRTLTSLKLRRTSNQTIADTIWTKILFDDVQEDNKNTFDSVNSEFTAFESGDHLFTVNPAFDGIDSGSPTLAARLNNQTKNEFLNVLLFRIDGMARDYRPHAISINLDKGDVVSLELQAFDTNGATIIGSRVLLDIKYQPSDFSVSAIDWNDY